QPSGIRWQETLVGAGEAVEGQAHLLEIVRRLDACGFLASLLDGRQQHADKNGDDSDYDQQLDQRESLGPARCSAQSDHVCRLSFKVSWSLKERFSGETRYRETQYGSGCECALSVIEGPAGSRPRMTPLLLLRLDDL